MLFARPPTKEEVHFLDKVVGKKCFHCGEYPSSRIYAVRARMVRYSIDGYSVAEISQMMDLHAKTIRKWVHLFNEKGTGGLREIVHRKKPYKRRTGMSALTSLVDQIRLEDRLGPEDPVSLERLQHAAQ